VQLVSKANPNRVAGTNRATTTGPHRRYEQPRNANPTQSGTIVRQFRGRRALSLGSREVHAPQNWPLYPPPYFAAFWLDPFGFVLEAVCYHDR